MLTAQLTKKIKEEKTLRVFGPDARSLTYLAVQMFKKYGRTLVLDALDYAQMQQFCTEIAWYAPEVPVFDFPAWDTQPYDRVAPDRVIQARRMAALSALKNGQPSIVVTTVNALSTKVPPLQDVPVVSSIKKGGVVDRDQLLDGLVTLGYSRVGTVMEPGEFAVRGAIIDIYPITDDAPVRLDFFDDEVESIHIFDPATQRSEGDCAHFRLSPAGELQLGDEKTATFRRRYRELFPQGGEDELYSATSEGLTHPLQLHYLPLFYDAPLPDVFDYLPDDAIFLADEGFAAARDDRLAQIADAYKARLDFTDDDYRVLPPQTLYLSEEEWAERMAGITHMTLSAFDDGAADLVHLKAEPLHFNAPFQQATKRVEEAAAMIKTKLSDGEKVVLTAFSAGGLARLEKVLAEAGLEGGRSINNWKQVKEAGLYQLISPLAWGFEVAADNLLLITEQDLFGEKQRAPVRRKRKAEEIISHFSELEVGDLIVHADHGIGRYQGLETLHVDGTAQDFVRLTYEGDDKLYVPVVSLDVISRYSGGEADSVRLDKLGGAGWQARKARVKKDLMAMAAELIKVAAARALEVGHQYERPEHQYETFCAGFPHVPTSEQQRAFDEVEADMLGPQPMDRLVVGDVGFGKTEVALRAAFVAAANHKQVAVVVPTTLLARQHYKNFSERFAGFNINVRQLSRLVSSKQANETKEGLKNGTVDIVIGTHALLAKSISFADLGLLIVDEEQHFGVAHKEKLKQMKENVDVLTLTATPIPRTLQMSMSGMKGLSMISTPPVDRLAVRSWVTPFDSKTIREAILREIHRGGQVYVVTPRLADMEKLTEKIEHLVPEAKVRTAHGQMPKEALERVMNDFYDGNFHVLVSTNIVESGLDVPRANTLIVNRADRFGLAQLYQLKGRVGRSKVRAYAYFLLPESGLSADAQKRLAVLQRLEGLGAGFKLASYDLDIRGAGNLLGKEQSGHIREIGYELYGQMLQEAMEELKAEQEGRMYRQQTFTPQLSLGVSFMIPEDYVTDLNARMTLYRRSANLHDEAEIEAFAQELLERFGPPPAEVTQLLDVIRIKNLCRALNIEKIDVGSKGAVLHLKNKEFAKPDALMQFIMQNKGLVSVRGDQSIVFHKVFADTQGRINGVKSVLGQLAAL